MIERLKRMERCSALPATVKFGNPNEFYARLEKESRDLVEWRGELVCHIFFFRDDGVVFRVTSRNGESSSLRLDA